ncbi:MAG: hypothetical protein HY231_11905 [Acidobacteria bacterium]|nr:hypothetical protein [Acidobacteriota bacterium]
MPSRGCTLALNRRRNSCTLLFLPESASSIVTQATRKQPSIAAVGFWFGVQTGSAPQERQARISFPVCGSPSLRTDNYLSGILQKHSTVRQGLYARRQAVSRSRAKCPQRCIWELEKTAAHEFCCLSTGVTEMFTLTKTQ